VTEKTKHVLAAFGGTPGAISPQFFMQVHTVVPQLIFQVSSKSVQVWGVITKNPSATPEGDFNIGSLRL